MVESSWVLCVVWSEWCAWSVFPSLRNRIWFLLIPTRHHQVSPRDCVCYRTLAVRVLTHSCNTALSLALSLYTPCNTLSHTRSTGLTIPTHTLWGLSNTHTHCLTASLCLFHRAYNTRTYSHTTNTHTLWDWTITYPQTLPADYITHTLSLSVEQLSLSGPSPRGADSGSHIVHSLVNDCEWGLVRDKVFSTCELTSDRFRSQEPHAVCCFHLLVAASKHIALSSHIRHYPVSFSLLAQGPGTTMFKAVMV